MKMRFTDNLMLALRFTALAYMNVAIIYFLLGYLRLDVLDELLSPIRAVSPMLLAASVIVAGLIVISDKRFSHLHVK
jgi:hypothetical protein